MHSPMQRRMDILRAAVKPAPPEGIRLGHPSSVVGGGGDWAGKEGWGEMCTSATPWASHATCLWEPSFLKLYSSVLSDCNQGVHGSMC